MGVQKLAAPGKTASSVPMALEAAKPKLAAITTPYLDEERLVALAKAVWSKTPSLKNCTPNSFLRAVYTAAQFGLDPTGIGSQGYIVAYGNEATFVRGWGGVITMAARNGISIETFAVYESDTFEVRRVTGVTQINHVEWRPPEGEDPGEVVACYAVAFSDSWPHPKAEVVWRHDIDKIRKNSSGSSAWKNWYSEMGRKTAVNRLAKRLPLFVDVKEAVEHRQRNGQSTFTSKKRKATPLAEVPAMHDDNIIEVEAVEEPVADKTYDSEGLLASAMALKESSPKEYREVFGRRHVSKMKEAELASMISKVEGIIATKEPDVVTEQSVSSASMEYEDELRF